MTKQEKIKEAYGEYWETVKDYVGENGWCDFTFTKDNEIIIVDIDMDADFPYGRPKTLQGIEHNNGWIKIESEKDLPEHGYYEVIQRGKDYTIRSSLNNEYNIESQLKYYSHYQPIIELKLPIY